MNGYDPDLMSPSERLNEAAGILADGILRLRMKKEAKTGHSETFRLDKPANQCPHVSGKTENFGG